LAAVALLLGSAAVGAQGRDRTDDFVNAEMKRQNIPGLSLAVLRDGTIIKAAGYGLANIKLKTRATPDTVYKTASSGKHFIATGIMLLVQDGRLGLDDPIRKYLDDAPAAWNGITVRHLLTHTAGLVREPPGFDPFKVQADAEVIRTAYPVPLRFVPGEKWEYSNTGYFALAETIRRVSGRPWSDYLTDRVFTPAGMLSTRTTLTSTRDRIANLAQGYVDNQDLREAPAWIAIRPSGAFLSTVVDLAKWDAVLYTDKVLTAASRQQMWTPVTLTSGQSAPYGFGWMIGQVKGQRLVHHSGGMPGARAAFARFVDAGLTIIVLMNLDDVDIESIVNGLTEIHLPGSSGAR
jgi:CubicO group peptidase (beta-lactamase class C family)